MLERLRRRLAAGGRRRVTRKERQRVEAEVMARYASLIGTLGFAKGLRLRIRIQREIERQLEQLARERELDTPR
jgi:hypothetical protein